jgi:RimJ/RimL family protein N-acetyltransferase
MPINSRSGEEPLNNSTISARPVQQDDAPFLLELYASTRAAELAVVPWTDEQRQAFLSMQFAAQQDHYRKQYPLALHEIVLVNERPIGQLYVARLEHEMRIIDFTIVPDQRNAGVGSFLLRRLLDEAALAAKVVRIYVEDFNPSLRLFERMGFKPVDKEGMHLLMEWTADGNATDQ